MKKIVGILAVCFLVQQSIFAAYCKIINGTNQELEITAFWGSKLSHKTITLAKGQVAKIDSGVHAFRGFNWSVKGSGIRYGAATPSSRFMQNGVLRIGTFSLEKDESGHETLKELVNAYTVNFDQNGVPYRGTLDWLRTARVLSENERF